MEIMDEPTKQVAYALHDLFGFDADNGEKARQIVDLLRRRGYTILLGTVVSEQWSAGYDAGRSDAYDDYGGYED